VINPRHRTLAPAHPDADESSMTYATVLFDLDHTLFDFDASEALAFAGALAVAGIDDPLPHLATYRRLNAALWAAAERGEIRSSTIRNLRFEQLALELGLDASVALDMADAYIAGLSVHGDLYPGARDVLETLHGRVAMAVVSNGLGEVVHARLDRLDVRALFDVVVVSSEVGVTKPDPGIFDVAFDRLGWPDKSSALMVGDSLTSDIAGGATYGIDTCWYNPDGRHPAVADEFAHEIGSLVEVLDVIGVTSTGDCR
jgi:YjjG family noncanonical pyrimidine nucleotidase